MDQNKQDTGNDDGYVRLSFVTSATTFVSCHKGISFFAFKCVTENSEFNKTHLHLS